MTDKLDLAPLIQELSKYDAKTLQTDPQIRKDAVTAACSQICNHLSESLFDMVLNMIYDYATTNVRSNAVRAVHQLVECVAYSDAAKTLAKFVPYCYRNIMTEIENGASSLRTTSASTLLPSDTTLHWSMSKIQTISLLYSKSFYHRYCYLTRSYI